MNTISFDIEAVSLGIERIKEIAPPFDPDKVKIGNRTDPKKIKACIEEAEANYYPNIEKEAALNPLYGRVDLIGVKEEGKDAKITIAPDDYNEGWLLQSFWHYFETSKVNSLFVGFNCFEYDLPFLINRSRINGVPFPRDVRKGRYFNDAWFRDLRDEWTLTSYSLREKFTKGSLPVLSKAFGGPEAIGSGKDYASMTEEERIAHLVRDLEMTEHLAKVML